MTTDLPWLGVVMPDVAGHGPGHGTNYPERCRCIACCVAWWDEHPGEQPAHRTGVARPHGSVARWAAGCDCGPCAAAWAAYEAAGGDPFPIGLQWRHRDPSGRRAARRRNVRHQS